MKSLLLIICALSVVILVQSEIFPGTSCAKQPNGKNWYLRDNAKNNVFYKCIAGKPVKKSCFFFMCACIGFGCAHAEGLTYVCALPAMCPALRIDTGIHITSCDTSPCKNSGVCQSDGDGGYECKCRTGFYGDVCQKDICNPNQCGSRGYCRRLPEGQFKCLCRRGYSGKNCEIDACEVLDCQHGKCNRLSEGKAECQCRRGYIGITCETDACGEQPCQNEGRCLQRKNEFGHLCHCKGGFSGFYCEYRNMTGNCETNNNCKHGSTCKSVQGDYISHECICRVGYEGIKCQYDHCIPQPCQNNGVCTRTQESHECACTTGFVGKYCEVDSCNPSPCQNSGTCTMVTGGYQCTCLIGYSGTECQIDHCMINRCKNGGTCIRTVESYNCTCAEGYHGPHCRIPDVSESPFDPESFFDCEYGFTSMTQELQGSLKDVEKCKTWCYTREDPIAQTVRRGCWYPGLFNEDPVLYAEPMKGCGIFADDLQITDTGHDRTYCFCRTNEGECNAGNLQTLIHTLPLLQRLV